MRKPPDKMTVPKPPWPKDDRKTPAKPQKEDFLPKGVLKKG